MTEGAVLLSTTKATYQLAIYILLMSIYCFLLLSYCHSSVEFRHKIDKIQKSSQLWVYVYPHTFLFFYSPYYYYILSIFLIQSTIYISVSCFVLQRYRPVLSIKTASKLLKTVTSCKWCFHTSLKLVSKQNRTTYHVQLTHFLNLHNLLLSWPTNTEVNSVIWLEKLYYIIW